MALSCSTPLCAVLECDHDCVMVVVIVCYFIFPTLDESVDGAGEEGDFNEQEDQGQGHFANQGKPSLDHTIVLLFFVHYFILQLRIISIIAIVA